MLPALLTITTAATLGIGFGLFLDHINTRQRRRDQQRKKYAGTEDHWPFIMEPRKAKESLAALGRRLSTDDNRRHG